MRLPRLRLWMLLIVVVVAGIALGVWATERRRAERLQRAAAFEAESKVIFQQVKAKGEEAQSLIGPEPPGLVPKLIFGPSTIHPSQAGDLTAAEDAVKEMLRLRRKAQWCRQQARKYRQAASHPWHHVEPDPPPPD